VNTSRKKKSQNRTKVEEEDTKVVAMLIRMETLENNPLKLKERDT
jgi:hypothetical protein